MKKQLSILLALLLVFPVVLSACGNQQEDARDQLGTRPMETIAPAKKETTAPTEEETTAPTEAETTAPAEEETTVPGNGETTPAGSSVTMGQIQGNTYTNEYVGIGMELDDSWRFYTEEELQSAYGKTAEMMTGTEMGSSIENVEQFTEMMAESSEALASINALYQKQDTQEKLVIQNLDQEAVLDIVLLTTKDAMIRSYEQIGIEVESLEKVEVPFLGETRYALKTVASTQGIPYYILQFIFYDKGEYMVTLTFNSLQNDITEDLAALCYPLD